MAYPCVGCDEIRVVQAVEGGEHGSDVEGIASALKPAVRSYGSDGVAVDHELAQPMRGLEGDFHGDPVGIVEVDRLGHDVVDRCMAPTGVDEALQNSGELHGARRMNRQVIEAAVPQEVAVPSPRVQGHHCLIRRSQFHGLGRFAANVEADDPVPERGGATEVGDLQIHGTE